MKLTNNNQGLGMPVLKVAILVPSLRGGGAERSMIDLASGFVDAGVSVDLVVINRQGELSESVDSRVNVIDLSRSRVGSSAFSIIRYLKNNKPEFLLSVMPHTSVVAYLAIKLSGIQTKLIPSQRTVLGRKDTKTNKLKRAFSKLLTKYVYRRSHAVSCVSEGVAADVIEKFSVPKKRVSVTYNPLVRDDFRLGVDMGKQPPHHWFTDEKPVILSVGRLEVVKGFDVLLESFAHLIKEKECKLIILGEGKERASLESKVKSLDISDSVLMPGFVNNVEAWMLHSDIFVLSSRNEGLPGVIVQALTCNTPVIATDCHSGPREILEDGKWGTLVPVEDPLALSGAILDELENPRKIKGVERARDFTVSKSVESYLKAMGLN